MLIGIVLPSVFIKRRYRNIINCWPKVKLGNTTHPDDPSDDSIDWNIGDVDCSSAKYFYSGRFIGFKYRNEIIWYEQKDSNKNIEKVAFSPSGNGIILYSDGKHLNCFYFGPNVHMYGPYYILRIENISTWRGSTQQFHSGSLYRTFAILICAILYIYFKVNHYISWNSHQLPQSHRRIFLSFWRKNCPSFETYWRLGKINQSGNCTVRQYHCCFCNNPNRWNYCSGINERSRTDLHKKNRILFVDPMKSFDQEWNWNLSEHNFIATWCWNELFWWWFSIDCNPNIDFWRIWYGGCCLWKFRRIL